MNDQDFVTISRMRAYDNIYHLVSKMGHLVGDQIHSLSTSERRMLRSLRELGVL